jgi:hypothetical protein
MNTPPIVSPKAWEAARQRMLAKEKAHMRAGDALAAERRQMPWAARNFPPGPPPDQTEVPARPHAGKAPGYQAGSASADTTADPRTEEMAQAGRRVAYESEGPNGKVSPTTLENHSHALSRFLIAFCSGAAATLAWWSYGDAARQMIASSYPQLLWSAPPRPLTAPEAPDMIVPDPNQLDATMRQSLDRIVAGQELITGSFDEIATTIAAGQEPKMRSSDQTATSIASGQEQMTRTDQTAVSVDQAPATKASNVTVDSQGDAAPLQPAARLTEERPPQTLAQKRKPLSAKSGYDGSCFAAASAVLQNHPGGWPTWTLRAPAHEGSICWFAAARPRGSDHRRERMPKEKETAETAEHELFAPVTPYGRGGSWEGGQPP